MASLLALQEPRLLTAEEFLEIDFGPDLKAELEDGVIRMMTGGTRRHNRIQVNLIAALRPRLRGSGCRPNGTDTAVRTHGMSVRYPDVSVTCGQTVADDERDVAYDPRLIVEILSPSTQRSDRTTKLNEYKALASVDTIVLVDPTAERLHVFQRTGPHGWAETDHPDPVDLHLPALGLTVPHDEIFARD